MGVIFTWFLLWVPASLLVTLATYAGWNLALAPWLGWSEMPLAVAILVGTILGACMVRVRQT